MKDKIWMIPIGMLLILAPTLAGDDGSPGDPAKIWVATNCCLDYEEVCTEVSCQEACLDWGYRCQTDCGQYCQWDCEEWGYGCYECCEVKEDVECQMDEDGPFSCLSRFTSANCTECCDEHECIGGWNETCTNRCIERCDEVCLLEGEACKCTSRAWKCNRWGPCYILADRVAEEGLDEAGSVEENAVPVEADQSVEPAGNSSDPEPVQVLEGNGAEPEGDAAE